MLGHPVREKIRNPNEGRDNTEIICNFIRLNVSGIFYNGNAIYKKRFNITLLSSHTTLQCIEYGM